MHCSTFLCIIAFCVALNTTVFGEGKEEEKKTGWNVGFLPAISFDSDVGFQYGGIVNLFDYGDGTRYPSYRHSLYIEMSRYTKGSGTYRLYYDSGILWNKIRIRTDLSYLPDRAYDFYGFNGYESVFNKNWEDTSSPDYKTRMFYKYDRSFFRFKTDLLGATGVGKLQWLGGLSLLNFDIHSVDINRLNKGKSGKDLLPQVFEQPGIYELYQQWGIINPEEATGGFLPVLKAGLVLDTRDIQSNAMSGQWSEVSLESVEKILGSKSSFGRINLLHCHYFTIIPQDLSFAVRVDYQKTLWGTVPFYYQNQIMTSVMAGTVSEGLGGGKNLRGILRNRIVGEGIAFSNAEFRWKFLRKKIFNQNFYFGLNAFVDGGRVTDRTPIEKYVKDLSVLNNSEFFKSDAEKMHYSAGSGLRAVMNQNFVLAVDYGMAFDKQDGTSGLYIGLNYLF
ncbi:MAG: BamA/TamA family outer membrane protein [Bacteroidota bacterium]|nr:BamA/TamA family outer membrane protein [Bacteroidota bacterium]